jgi:LacI family transcriptional regulator
MAVTISDIARRARVSKVTVSNVLRKEGRFAESTRERVLKAARDMGYRPSAAARAITRGRFGAVGILTSTSPARSGYSPFLEGMSKACHRHDMSLLISEVEDEKLSDRRCVPKLLREWMVDGLVIAYMQSFPRMLAELVREFHIPSVWMNSKHDVDCVHPDDYQGAALGTEHLIQQGHRRIAYLCQLRDNHYSAVDRRTGYCSTMIDAGLSPEVIYPGDQLVGLNQLYSDMKRMFEREDRPTAVVCYSSEECVATFHAASTAGLRVPQDLSLLGLGSHTIIGAGPVVTTIRFDAGAVASQTIEMLRKKIRHPAELIPPEAVSYEIDRPEATVTSPPRLKQ